MIKQLYLSIILVPLLSFSTSAAAYSIYGTKFGDPTMGTGGGTVSWSFLPTGSSCLDGICTHVSEFMDSGYEYIFERAFNVWAEVADIHFVQVATGESSDIGIAGHDFDWPAHAYYPSDSQVHFSTLFEWGNEGIPIFPIAIHEIGHAIGLEHSNEVDSAMYYLGPGYHLVYGLHADDIAGIQEIYGARPAALPATIWLLCMGLVFLVRSMQLRS